MSDWNQIFVSSELEIIVALSRILAKFDCVNNFLVLIDFETFP